mgnify:CR=1 FL=1
MSAEPPIDGYCPHCGAEVPEEALACPECGSCSETGWSTKASYDRIGVDSDDEPFDYEGFLEEEFGDGKPARRSAMQWVWAIVAFLLLVLLLKHAHRAADLRSKGLPVLVSFFQVTE